MSNTLTTPALATVLVLAWVKHEGPAANAKGKACVWSRDMADRERGEIIARREGCTLMLLEDTDDVLDVARLLIEVRARQ